MSYLEFAGTVLYLLSVWLMTKRHLMTWPIGLVAVILYMALFYQIQLYADAIEQLYYVGASIWGWLLWTRAPRANYVVDKVTFSPPTQITAWIGAIAVCSATFGYLLTDIHTLLPTLFSAPASLPYLDALTTVMSFAAMWLLVKRRIESWVYWIIVDVIGIGLYFYKGVIFVSLLYVLLLFLAIKGFVQWRAQEESK
ncbi:MAG: nicotinamide riboside transporter PnuC [Gammaproteobacteria bacterium]|nr:nicotinamide riboside transporter PnuC [Gammaproteobacteria bacterium]